MDQWNGSMKPFFSRPPDNPTSFLYNTNFHYDQNPAGMEMKHHPRMLEIPHHFMAPADMDNNNVAVVDCMNSSNNHLERKKKLRSDQLDSLERCFQEEIKLHPERKMQLARELGLQPRQIAVWFQNRRARWKNKQLEHLYNALKQEYDAVSRQKQKLQEEVIKLQEIIREQQGLRKQQQQQVSGMGFTESGEETVESTQHDVGCSNGTGSLSRRPAVGKSNYYHVEDYNTTTNNVNNTVASNYLGGLPPYP